jgi:hypothetical protein
MYKRASLIVLIVCLAALPLSAHKTYRIIGTITKVSKTALAVKQAKTGNVITMKMDGSSAATRDKKDVPLSELKVGLSVVVDACGDSLKDLLVEEVRIVPSVVK